MLAPPGQAHNLQTTLTEISWSVERAELQVVHSVHIDDAMHLLAALGAADGRLTVPVEARLMRYLENNFSLHLDQQKLPLRAVGAQFQGDFLWLYQDLAQVVTPADWTSGLAVSTTFMQEVFAGQSHRINLLLGTGNVRTLHLHKDLHKGTF